MALSYQDEGLWNPETGGYSPYPSYSESVAGGVDFGGGWSQTLQDLAKIGANTWAQTTLMQSNVQGQRYIEGQRIAALQAGLGIRPQTLLLIGGAVVVYLLAKG